MSESSKASEKDKGSSSTSATTSEESDVRAESQSQTDHVAMVSRTATGDAHQHQGYEVIGLPEDATEAQKAAAENRPERRRKR